LKYDDITTLDVARSPVVSQTVKDNFVMSYNLGSNHCKRRVVGTYYAHDDPLTFIVGQKLPSTGQPMWNVRVIPSTHDGTFNGTPVLLSQERIEILKADRHSFATQHLCNPTPIEDARLPWHFIQTCAKDELPTRLFKFMLVDPAGGSREDGREADSWGIWVCGVEPHISDEEGLSRVFLLDGFVGTVPWEEGVKEVVRVYLRNGFIHWLGVEKVGTSTFEVHVSNALRAKGRLVTQSNGMLRILSPKGRKKEKRIEGAISTPLHAGFITICDTVPLQAKTRLKEEMEKYPAWKLDGLDALSYLWDLMAEFPAFPTAAQMRPVEAKPKDLWDRIMEAAGEDEPETSWMAV
jgi:hypothetical protein